MSTVSEGDMLSKTVARFESLNPRAFDRHTAEQLMAQLPIKGKKTETGETSPNKNLLNAVI